jgi:hypothetical protein
VKFNELFCTSRNETIGCSRSLEPLPVHFEFSDDVNRCGKRGRRVQLSSLGFTGQTDASIFTIMDARRKWEMNQSLQA